MQTITDTSFLSALLMAPGAHVALQSNRSASAAFYMCRRLIGMEASSTPCCSSNLQVSFEAAPFPCPGIQCCRKHDLVYGCVLTRSCRNVALVLQPYLPSHASCMLRELVEPLFIAEQNGAH
mmetsp:Transcript_1390/g.2413  ORF Transcript_1390/g.2413 Transcript_1390/m.2413 type:complete len:122 (+) Transcript_1390:17-382(+)